MHQNGNLNPTTPDLVASITDPLGGVTSFKYDANGNLTNVTDALSHSVTYGYDNMDQLTSRTDQLGRQETYWYDKAGNVTNFVDRRGVSIAFKYDTLDRRTGVVYAANDSVRYFYDKVGRVTNITDSVGGTIKLTYDSLDRLTLENNNNGTVTYTYNDVGLRSNMTVTGETAVFYRYDAANRLTNVVQGTFTSALAYDDAGRRTNLTLPNGVKVLYRYDAASRLTNLTYQAAVTNSIAYSYDDVGNRVAQASSLSTYQLPASISNASYNAANQQTAFGTYTIQYDSAGNVTNIVSGTTTNRLAWSARNQLTNMTGAATANFLYDGLGRRITRTVGSNTEKYLYDGLDTILQKDSGGTVKVRYFRGLAIDEPWQRIDVASKAQNNTNRVYLADALGSVVALTDTAKAIATEYDYEPFGKSTVTGISTLNHYGFTGREDDATGLLYYRARYYHPVLGRFVSEDPIEYAGGDVNLYGYVGNSVLNWTDSLGLFGDGLYGKAGSDWQKGHSDFVGSDQFNYTREDYGWSNPINPVSTKRHFQPLDVSIKDANAAMDSGNKEAFERAMHRLQDYFSHYEKGYRAYSTLGHIPGGWWDSMHGGWGPDHDKSAWRRANAATQHMLNKWNARHPRKCQK